eukprot:GAHX01001041.1.p1 GENE.GAHX01001041.1~~GAHX01001041.1.p1  ORF type:complete len:517 (-),score=72.79 GAHX01001041.1:94-1608(-)
MLFTLPRVSLLLSVVCLVYSNYIPPSYLTLGVHISQQSSSTQFSIHNLILNTPNTDTNLLLISNYLSLITPEHSISDLIKHKREERLLAMKSSFYLPYETSYNDQVQKIIGNSQYACYELIDNKRKASTNFGQLINMISQLNFYFEFGHLKTLKDQKLYAFYHPIKSKGATTTVGFSYVLPVTGKTANNTNLLKEKQEIFEFVDVKYQHNMVFDCLNFSTYGKFLEEINDVYKNSKPVTYVFIARCEHGCITTEESIYALLTKIASLVFFVLFFFFMLKLMVFKYSIQYEETMQVVYFTSNLIFATVASVWYLNKRTLSFLEVFSYNLAHMFMGISLGVFTMLMLSDEFKFHNALVHLNNFLVSIVFFIAFIVNMIFSMIPKRHLKLQIYRSWTLMLIYIFIFFTAGIIKSKRLNSGRQVQGTSFAKRKILFLLLMIGFVTFLGLFMFKIVEEKGGHRVIDCEIIIMAVLINLIGMLFILFQVGNRKRRVRKSPKKLNVKKDDK